ncbi:hypothetical protein [Bradyrhizobium sp. WYCCWR 12699]|uniref:DUF1127 domain-containing protein n=1 Tax=Bradyrhizobium sp. WYCCWR 12699 TaxID=3064203 RepID=UPI0028A49EBB|nr:hypothetical protein [Bradyrhizobium sp. WYCCWR 12699]MDT4737243.1 hypothetical protein [Bradyrhizobium sp. WYCCWR 12699]
MSTLITNSDPPPQACRDATAADHQSSSWLAILDRWLTRFERMHQRVDLREIANDPHLLADIGFTREEALDQANKPFWR